ncbi:hypothetical protein LO762_08625 [Actinocorallia sp. API 0066]|uniref:hypothetical protein n=1 Tax=Actinocorallia sp. API 0066 TaxID=2896846 RepID=UPI001E597C71|nr:hypothetical protein [Actinocorallia sp. API 0066]MCD0449250.1 hypothetical protein [Actinocorallia sp. API 0066]
MPGSELPIVCTLSPNAMYERLTDFETLYAEALTGVVRGPLSLRLTFEADGAREVAIRALFAAEQRCCAFLGFGFDRTEAGFVVEISAPEAAGATLDGMQSLAERAIRVR